MKRRKGYDLSRLKPYGDRLGDGKVQLSFTLPVEVSEKARSAAILYAQKLGLREVQLAHMEEVGHGFTFFILYGSSKATIDYSSLAEIPTLKVKPMTFREVNESIEKSLGRKAVVIGATIGSDAHTTGLDAILSMKGYAGEKGLEAYAAFEVINLGSQVECALLIQRALKEEADCLLISQVVTQRDVHKQNLSQLKEVLEKKGLRQRFLLIIGGPRIDQALAEELGFDAGFGPFTRPNQVASFIAQRLYKKK